MMIHNNASISTTKPKDHRRLDLGHSTSLLFESPKNIAHPVSHALSRCHIGSTTRYLVEEMFITSYNIIPSVRPVGVIGRVSSDGVRVLGNRVAVVPALEEPIPCAVAQPARQTRDKREERQQREKNKEKY